MRELPDQRLHDQNGKLREDGRVMRDMYLFQVKTPAESKYPFDYFQAARRHPRGPGLPPP